MSIVPAPVARQPWQMLIPLFALVTVGTFALTSAANGNFTTYAQPHLIRFTVFLVMAMVMTRFSRSFVQFMAYPAYVAILVLLVVVEAIGAVRGGAQSWLDLGFMELQPSELMKPGIVLVLARFFGTLPIGMVPTWRALVPSIALVGLPTALVLLQPDLGTATGILLGGLVVIFLAGLPLAWFVGAGAVATVVAPLVFYFGLHEYQQRRVFSFLDPENDPLGAGYHITQSKIAIGSAGVFGKGFGEGTQTHLSYLPEAHTDFVFATFVEEWGFVGGLFILAAFAAVLAWGLSVARRSQDRFAKLLAAGMTANIFFYVAINLMMVLGLAPVVGIPLPFISHGGSSMMTNMICIGTLMMVNRWNRRAPRGGLAT
jgi:rod shape determining protein RodA